MGSCQKKKYFKLVTLSKSYMQQNRLVLVGGGEHYFLHPLFTHHLCHYFQHYYHNKLFTGILVKYLCVSSSSHVSSSSLESSGATYSTSRVISPCTVDKTRTASLCLASWRSMPLTARIASPTYNPPARSTGKPSWISETMIGTPCSFPPYHVRNKSLLIAKKPQSYSSSLN